MSFREIAVTIRAVNRASTAFNRVEADAVSLASRVKNLGNVMAGLGAAGTAIGYMASQFGILNDAQARTFNSIMMVVSAMGFLMRTETGLAIAQKVYAAACAFATVVQNTLNISFATFLALTGVGVAVIVAAAAAMWSFANSMNAATSSVQDFNAAAAETPTHTRSIQRAGENATQSYSNFSKSPAPQSRNSYSKPPAEPKRQLAPSKETHRNTSDELARYRRGVE